MICKGLSNECCVCVYADSCMTGCRRNTFEPASKSEIIKRLCENKFQSERKDMIKYLKIRYGVNFINYIKDKESEDNKMLHKVTVTKTEEKVLEEYWVMRGATECEVAKRVVAERTCDHNPTSKEIAQFLYDSNTDFVSVEHNYRFESDLPFC